MKDLGYIDRDTKGASMIKTQQRIFGVASIGIGVLSVAMTGDGTGALLMIPAGLFMLLSPNIVID